MNADFRQGEFKMEKVSSLLECSDVTPHPLREFFKGRLKQSCIAKAVGVSYANIGRILCGYIQAKPDVETKLKRLAAEIRDQNDN